MNKLVFFIALLSIFGSAHAAGGLDADAQSRRDFLARQATRLAAGDTNAVIATTASMQVNGNLVIARICENESDRQILALIAPCKTRTMPPPAARHYCNKPPQPRVSAIRTTPHPLPMHPPRHTGHITSLLRRGAQPLLLPACAPLPCRLQPLQQPLPPLTAVTRPRHNHSTDKIGG